MDSMQVLFNMDGYGGFVWPAFAVTIIVMVALLIATLRSLRVRESTLASLRATGGRTGSGEADDET